MSRKCLAKNRTGKRWGAWALTGGKQCALHSDPERAAIMGSRRGRKAIFSAPPNALDIPYRSLKSRADGLVLNFVLGALARLELARAYALQSDTAKARAAYQNFFTLWKDADSDIPILKEAKAEYAKLQ